ncbi:glycoside hydrolase family 18 protein [Longispora albida]|uniref:glycoside hydrolase family 18 protein n=1 Tax=Longispora albida TaxID=203523 RepID=UPI0003744B76|nr:glycoside hydrolase family 18 protein [Longispora albida]
MPTKRRRSLALAGTTLVAALVSLLPGAPAPASAGDQSGVPKKVVTAYFADWDVYGRQYFVKDIPATKLNVIQYAFGYPTFDRATGAVGCAPVDPWADYQQVYWSGENTVDGVADNYPDQRLYGNFNQIRKLKAKYPHLRVEISLGGWTKSTWFSTVAATPERRRAFVKSCVDTFIKGDLPTGGWPENAGGPGAARGVFDGIDIDWEYPTAVAGGNVDPRPEDRRNATLLFEEFRRQLDTQGRADKKHYLLTAALPATTKSTKYFELAKVSKILDWVNVMTYDYTVGGDTITGPSSPFGWDPRDPNSSDLTWNTVGTVAQYLTHGVRPDKLVVGVPFYGVQFLRTNGLYQPHDSRGLDPNTLRWDSTPNPAYRDVANGIPGLTKSRNPLTGEPSLYGTAEHQLCGAFNPDGTCKSPYTEATTTLITYTDPESIRLRAGLVRALGLRGLMAWELSQDSPDSALLSEMAKIL